MWMYELCVGCAWKRTAVCGRACALCTCCESLYTVSVSMCARPPACLRVCFHRCPVGCFGWRYTCVFGHVCVCVCVWLSEWVGGQAREQLHSEEEFCSADDYTCRADATPAAGTLTAKVTEPGWHREGTKGTGRECACVCVRAVAGCRMKQLSYNGNSKGRCRLSILCIRKNNINTNQSDKRKPTAPSLAPLLKKYVLVVACS